MMMLVLFCGADSLLYGLGGVNEVCEHTHAALLSCSQYFTFWTLIAQFCAKLQALLISIIKIYLSFTVPHQNLKEDDFLYIYFHTAALMKNHPLGEKRHIQAHSTLRCRHHGLQVDISTRYNMNSSN